jgi:hypothetical protein
MASRLGLRDLVACGVKCGLRGGKHSKTKSWTVSWLSLKTNVESGLHGSRVEDYGYPGSPLTRVL